MKNDEKYKYLDVLDISELNKCEMLIIIVELKKLKFKNLAIFLNYLSSYKNKVLGWYFLDLNSNF